MKKSFKRLLSLTAALVMLATVFPVALPVSAWEVTDPSSNIIYNHCVGYTRVWNTKYPCAGDLVIPESFQGYPVTQIWTGALNYTNITSVVIPNTVTSLGSGWTFDGCRRMKTVVNSDSVKVIPQSAFSNCDVLTSIHIGNSVTEIEGNAFAGCPKLKHIVLPMTIREIGSYAFDSSSRGVGFVYYPGTVSQWKKVEKGYGVEEKMLYQPTVSSVKTTSKGVQVTASKRNATKYTFYRQTQTKGKWSGWNKLVTTSKNTYTDKSAVVGRTYRYAVKATNGAYTTRLSGNSKAITHLPSPTVKAAKATKGYKVTWSKIAGASKYILYRRVGSGKWRTLKTTTARSYTDKTAKDGYKYQYGVKAVKGSLKSALSTTNRVLRLSTPKVKKTDIASTDTDGWWHTGIKITWSKVKGAAKYEVYRREGSGSWCRLTTTTSRSYVDEWVTSGKYYTYRVKAINGTVTSSAGTTTKTKYLIAPSVGAYKAYGGIYVNWSSATGAKGYVLYRRVGSGKWTKIKTTKSRDFVDRTAKKGKTYQYKVVAINGKYKSASFTSDKIKR